MADFPKDETISVNGVNIHYVRAGSGDPILLLHGIPTYSYLWRNIMDPLAGIGCIIAPDLPGYGLSDKPVDAPYTIPYYTQMLDGFITALGLDRLRLAVHDLGGPVGLLWAIEHSDQVRKIAILNTVVHPDFSRAMKMTLAFARIPGLSHLISSPVGISSAIKWGVHRSGAIDQAVYAAYRAPFFDQHTRNAYLKTLRSIEPAVLADLINRLPDLRVPIHIICGEKDGLLAPEMHQLRDELPNAGFTSMNDCGHFVQEDDPERLADILKGFFES